MTDGRFSGGSVGLVIGHRAPETLAVRLALLRDGDTITTDLVVFPDTAPDLSTYRKRWLISGGGSVIVGTSGNGLVARQRYENWRSSVRCL